MIRKSALLVSGVMARRGIIDSGDIDVYAYGFELMISTGLNILIVIAISVLFSMPLAWCFFLLPFIPLRLTAGGYHAGSHLACGITFTVAYAILLLPAVFLPSVLTPPVLLGISAVNLLLVLLLSPLPASSKPLEGAQKDANRKRSIAIAGASLLVTAASFLAGPRFLWMFAVFALGQAGAAISLITARIMNKV